MSDCIQVSPLSFNTKVKNNINQITFRAAVSDYPDDSYEGSGKHNYGLSEKARLGIGLGTVGAIAIAIGLISKGRVSEAKQLAEHIDFIEAKTIADAIKFGKEKLGIHSYKGFEEKDIDVINWVNKGFVNTSNKMKGKLRLPRQVVYDEKYLGENTTAGVVSDKGLFYGWFGINKRIFNNLNKSIDETLANLEKNEVLSIKMLDNGNMQFKTGLFSAEDLKPLFKQLFNYKNGNITSFNDKLRLYYDLEQLCIEHNSAFKSPLSKIRKLVANKEAKAIFEKDGILTDLRKIEKLSTKEQLKILDDMWNHPQVEFKLKHQSGDIYNTIYHEMGHLQDVVPRVAAAGKFKSENDYPNELKEWLENEKIQQIASEVSGYAATGPGEFIAETFAEMVSGRRKLSNEVMTLYRKMNGPAVN